MLESKMLEGLHLEVNEDFIFERFKKRRDELSEDISIIREWMRSQPHLPEIMEDDKIRNFIVSNKCSIEKTKKKIDMYYTIRSLIPEAFDVCNPKLSSVQETLDVAYCFPLPKLTDEGYRVSILKLRQKEKVEVLQPINIITISSAAQEVRLKEDLMLGDVFILDMDGFTLDYLIRVAPSVFVKTLKIYEKVYSIPLKGLYLINASPIASTLVKVMKSVMKPKLFDRVHVFGEGPEVLRDYLPAKILPRDFGGEEKSLEELHELYKKMVRRHQPRFDALDKLRVNEELRPQKLENDEMLGFYGNFKQLNID